MSRHLNMVKEQIDKSKDGQMRPEDGLAEETKSLIQSDGHAFFANKNIYPYLGEESSIEKVVDELVKKHKDEKTTVTNFKIP